MPFRLLLLIALLPSIGCATSPTAEQEVALILDEWKDPQGLSDEEIIAREDRVLEENPLIHLSPFVFPTFEALYAIDGLVLNHGYDAVYDALAAEIRDRKRLRVNRALTLLSHIDPTDSWMDVWLGSPDETREMIESGTW
jgi:hypothetical protein